MPGRTYERVNLKPTVKMLELEKRSKDELTPASDLAPTTSLWRQYRSIRSIEIDMDRSKWHFDRSIFDIDRFMSKAIAFYSKQIDLTLVQSKDIDRISLSSAVKIEFQIFLYITACLRLKLVCWCCGVLATTILTN
jgi:hypothetical protein